MQVPLQPGLTARAKPRLVLFDDQHPAPQLCGGSDAWCWTGDEIAAVAIRRPDSRDIAAVAEQAYREAWQQLSANGHAHWLRTWTYFDDILQGEGDAERYRQFCLGRARGLPRDAGFPAATVIGSASPGFWLWVIAARSPGQRFENPRQTPAWQYPREYGPQSPGFSRALWWAPGGLLLLSGTSSVVGHATVHAGDGAAQLDETLANIDALVMQVERDLGRVLKAGSLRLYVRDPAHVALLAQCRARWPGAEWSAHQGTICRADLAVEIEGVFVAEPEPREN
ncbi:MAG: pteridine-dependent deoxygenase [Gammaproteobacteria bacterium]|nr:pteridine-dependent deoxygenase [Gammaproteobacteria bacterium]